MSNTDVKQRVTRTFLEVFLRYSHVSLDHLAGAGPELCCVRALVDLHPARARINLLLPDIRCGYPQRDHFQERVLLDPVRVRGRVSAVQGKSGHY